jgi:hypothetical protein
VHVPREDKSDDVKSSFYEKQGCVLDQFPTYDMKILVDDFNAKVGSEDILKLTIRTSLHGISNNNGVRVINFATSKNLAVKSTMFPHCNTQKYTWTS